MTPLAPLFAELDLILTDAQKPLDQYPDSWDVLRSLPYMKVSLSDGEAFIHGGFNKETGKYFLTFHTDAEESNALYRWEHSPAVPPLSQQICTEVDIQYAQENP